MTIGKIRHGRAAGRIVVDARTLRGDPGGVASYTEALIEHLPATLPEVAIVLLRHPRNPRALSRAPNVTEWILGGKPNSPWTYSRMGSWLNTRLSRDDLFHAPYRILPRGLNAKSVITIHDVMQIVCPELVFPNPIIRAVVQPFWSTAIRSAIRRADRILAVSQHSADDTLRVDPSCGPRLRVTLNGRSPSFRPMAKADAEHLSASIVSLGRRFFFVVGGGYPNKNHVTAVSAFAKAFPRSQDICLLVIQRRRTRPKELRQLLRRLAFDSRIQVRRDVRNDELVALYNRAEALVFPSLYEGFGLPVLEAMACGCPVICSNVTSLPEVAGKAALFVEPKDEEAIAEAMRRIVEDDNLRQSLAQKGVQRAALFDWRKTVAETVLVYREIAPWLPDIKLAL
ncbi:MAG TPA: glycosyltransferase family 1 protein [Chthoniobacterales bacterium]|nr:glycosyltransferase family 1 protein [Chthoniobacterales bacterium]